MVMSMPSPSSALVLAKMKSRKSGLKSLPPAAPARSRLWSVVEPTAVMVTVRVPRTAETSVAAAVPVPARDSKPGWMKGRMSSMSTARVEPAAGLGKTSGSRGLVGHEISVPSPKESPSESYLVGSVPGWAGPVEGRSGFSVASGRPSPSESSLRGLVPELAVESHVPELVSVPSWRVSSSESGSFGFVPAVNSARLGRRSLSASRAASLTSGLRP
jgi:hypothetical protein